MTDHILYILYLIHTYTTTLHCTREHLVAVSLDCRLPGIKFPPYELFSMWWWCLVAESCPTLLWPHGLWPIRLLCPWGFPGKNTGVGCHFFLQGIFLTQGSNLCLLYWKAGALPLSHQCVVAPSMWPWTNFWIFWALASLCGGSNGTYLIGLL